MYHSLHDTYTVQASHVDRAFRLLRILEGVRIGFRKGFVPEGEDPAVVPRAVSTGTDDHDIAGAPEIDGTTTTEVVRRLIIKSTHIDNGGGARKIWSGVCWSLWPKSVRTAKTGSISVYAIRTIA